MWNHGSQRQQGFPPSDRQVQAVCTARLGSTPPGGGWGRAASLSVSPPSQIPPLSWRVKAEDPARNYARRHFLPTSMAWLEWETPVGVGQGMGRPASGRNPPSLRFLEGPLPPSEIHFGIPPAGVGSLSALNSPWLIRKLEAQGNVEVKGHTPEPKLQPPHRTVCLDKWRGLPFWKLQVLEYLPHKAAVRIQ